MKKEIKVVDEAKGIAQITTTDERWYTKMGLNDGTGLPEMKFVPSVTWIAGHYPKGIGFYKWLAEKGWDESEAIKQAAGNKGSKVHQAIEQYLKGERIGMSDVFTNKETGKGEELTVEEYNCIVSFANWFKSWDIEPEVLAQEVTVFNDKEGYAGTVDLIIRTKNPLAPQATQIWLIDNKTSQYVWPEYEIQVSAYKHASLPVKITEDEKANMKLAILQIGYSKNKNNYKFTEIEDKFDLFLAAKKIWANETEGQKPSQKDYPLFVERKPKEEVKVELPIMAPQMAESETKAKKAKTK